MGGFSGYTRVDYDGVGGGVDPMEEAVLFAMYLYDQAWTSAPGARKEKPLAPKTILDYVSRVGVQLQLHGEGEFLEFTFLYKRLAAQLRAEPRDGNWKSPASILMVREIVTNGLLSMGLFAGRTSSLSGRTASEWRCGLSHGGPRATSSTPVTSSG